MSACCARQVPFLSDESIFDGVEGSDLLEEIEAVVPLWGMREIGKGGISWPRHDRNDGDAVKDCPFDLVHHENGTNKPATADADPNLHVLSDAVQKDILLTPSRRCRDPTYPGIEHFMACTSPERIHVLWRTASQICGMIGRPRHKTHSTCR